MSASEKLKALESQLFPGMTGDVRTLAYALPQIVAVVEAAEFGYSQLSQEYDAWPELRAALSALEEALT